MRKIAFCTDTDWDNISKSEQAFLKPAQEIYSKIQRGIYDVSNESYGIKVGIASQSSNPVSQPGPGGKKQGGGCCLIL